MADRYFSAEPIQDNSTVTLVGSEAHHLLHVMRATSGLEVVLFDGRGGEYRAEAVRCDRSTIEFVVGERLEIERELPFAITLAVTLPKGDRQRWLIEKAVELGVGRLVPLQTDRSAGGGISPKFNRYIIEASKQCGRNRLMELQQPAEWADFLTTAPTARRMVAHPGGAGSLNFDVQSAEDLVLAVGPEGGFTDAEIAQAVATGWEMVDLGERILRIETAAIALVAAATMV